MLSDIFYERGAIFDEVAAANVKLWSMGDYIYTVMSRYFCPADSHAASTALAGLNLRMMRTSARMCLSCTHLSVVRRPFGRQSAYSSARGA